MPEEFMSRLKSSGVELRSFKLNSKQEEILSKHLHNRGIIEDKRVIARLDKTLEFNKNVASVYSPDKLLDSISSYYERVQKAKFPLDNQLVADCLNDVKKAFMPRREIVPLLNDFKSITSVLQPDKSAGFPIFGKRMDSLDYYFNRFLDVLHSKKQFFPTVVETRTQRMNSETESKVRLVHAFSSDSTMAEGKFARPLIDYYLENQVHPIAYGLTKVQLSSSLIAIQNRKFRYSIDYSKFDSSIHRDLIYKMFTMIKSWFKLDDLDTKLFNKVVKFFLKTPLLTPWGLIIPQSGGIPSGSYFTQIIGSMVNYFLISYIIRSNGLKPFQELIKVLGDDCVLGINYKLNNLEEIESVFGVTINVSKTEVNTNGDPIHFLGRYYNFGLAHVDPKESLTKAVYPERSRKIDNNQVELLLSSYLMEGVENAEWVFKSVIFKPGDPVTFRNFLYEWRDGHTPDYNAIMLEGSRQYMLANMEGRELPTFLNVSLLA